MLHSLRTSSLAKQSAQGKGSSISRFSSCSAREQELQGRRFAPGLGRVTHAPGDSSRTQDSRGSGRNSSSCVGSTGTSRSPPGGRTGTLPGSPGPQRPTLENKGRKGDTYRAAHCCGKRTSATSSQRRAWGQNTQVNNTSGPIPCGSGTRSTLPLVSKQKWHMTVKNELQECGPFWQHLCLAERRAAQRQEPCFPSQKPFAPQQTCANAPLALGPHQRLFLLGHVHALLMCLFPAHILVLMGQTMVKSRL